MNAAKRTSLFPSGAAGTFWHSYTYSSRQNNRCPFRGNLSLLRYFVAKLSALLLSFAHLQNTVEQRGNEMHCRMALTQSFLSPVMLRVRRTRFLIFLYCLYGDDEYKIPNSAYQTRLYGRPSWTYCAAKGFPSPNLDICLAQPHRNPGPGWRLLAVHSFFRVTIRQLLRYTVPPVFAFYQWGRTATNDCACT